MTVRHEVDAEITARVSRCGLRSRAAPRRRCFLGLRAVLAASFTGPCGATDQICV
jgi:hypothetical protein